MGNEITNLDDGGLTPSSPTFAILPRGRETLKKRFINKCNVFTTMPEAIWEEVKKRLGITDEDLDKMTGEELATKVNPILGDIFSGLTLKQVLNLLGSDTYSPKDGDTLRANIVAVYSKSSGDAETSDPGTPLIPVNPGGVV